MQRFRPMHRLLACAALTILPALAAASDYPSRPITLIVPFAPGGNVDATARSLGPALARELGQPVVIDNRAGAGGTLGSGVVARAQPDGYTLMVGSTATNATAPAFMKSSYDPVKDFTSLGALSVTPSVIVVGSDSPARNYGELVALSQSRPTGLNMGSPGTGSLNHLTTELLQQKTGLKATHIPYKGAGPALTDLMGGQLDAMVDQLSSSSSLIAAGRLRAVAQTGTARSPLLPDVPTLREQQVQDVDVAVYTGLFAPAGLPEDVQQKLVKALQAAVQGPEFLERLKAQGSEPLPMSQAQFASFVAEEAERWSGVIERTGLAGRN
jgi:tripartite-type tricarboxylate transporter receptor subunit TctC